MEYLLKYTTYDRMPDGLKVALNSLVLIVLIVDSPSILRLISIALILLVISAYALVYMLVLCVLWAAAFLGSSLLSAVSNIDVNSVDGLACILIVLMACSYLVLAIKWLYQNRAKSKVGVIIHHAVSPPKIEHIILKKALNEVEQLHRKGTQEYQTELTNSQFDRDRYNEELEQYCLELERYNNRPRYHREETCVIDNTPTWIFRGGPEPGYQETVTYSVWDDDGQLRPSPPRDCEFHPIDCAGHNIYKALDMGIPLSKLGVTDDDLQKDEFAEFRKYAMS